MSVVRLTAGAVVLSGPKNHRLGPGLGAWAGTLDTLLPPQARAAAKAGKSELGARHQKARVKGTGPGSGAIHVAEPGLLMGRKLLLQAPPPHSRWEESPAVRPGLGGVTSDRCEESTNSSERTPRPLFSGSDQSCV